MSNNATKSKRFLFALCFICSVLGGDSNLFSQVPCKFILAVTSELDTNEIHEIGVFAGKDFDRNTILETQPSALFYAFETRRNILFNYVHGFNASHAVLLFGSSSLFNHGFKNLVDNVYVPADPWKYGTPYSSVRILSKIPSGEEMFGYYNAVEISKTTGGLMGIPWFQNRGLVEVNTSDPEIYPIKLSDSHERLQGCTDNSHIKVKTTAGVELVLEVKSGEVIETNRVLFIHNTQFSDLESTKNLELFWSFPRVKKALSLGVILPFATFTADEEKANVRMEWWNNQVSFSANMGMISVVATKDIKPGEEIILFSSSATEKIFPEHMSAAFEAQITWMKLVIEYITELPWVSKLYIASALLFGSLSLIC